MSDRDDLQLTVGPRKDDELEVDWLTLTKFVRFSNVIWLSKGPAFQ